jgi:hypothetical protein
MGEVKTSLPISHRHDVGLYNASYALAVMTACCSHRAHVGRALPMHQLAWAAKDYRLRLASWVSIQ